FCQPSCPTPRLRRRRIAPISVGSSTGEGGWCSFPKTGRPESIECRLSWLEESSSALGAGVNGSCDGEGAVGGTGLGDTVLDTAPFCAGVSICWAAGFDIGRVRSS